MSSVPGHWEIQEKLPAAALEILDTAEMEQVRAHLRVCAECAMLLEDYCAAATVMAQGLPTIPMHPASGEAVRARLLARAQAKLWHTRKASSMIYQWSGWMVAAGLAGVLLVHHSVHRPLDYGWLAAGLLLMVLLGVGIYARVQRRRLAELRERLTGTGLPWPESERKP